MSKEHEEQLDLFLEVVEKLKGKSFGKKLMSQNSLSMSGRKDEMTIDDFDEESLESFLLTFRFLVQDNEASSIRNICDLLRDREDLNEQWGRVNGSRWMINDFLDREKWPAPCGGEFSFRQIMDTFLYGQHAHKNPIKRRRLADWRQHNDQYTMLMVNFLVALKVVFDGASKIADAIQNIETCKMIEEPAPITKEFTGALQDKRSIQLLSSATPNDDAIKAYNKRILLNREVNAFLLKLGTPKGQGANSINTNTNFELRNPDSPIVGGDASYSGARVTVNGDEIDPDRSICYAIGFLKDWRISVVVRSSQRPSEVIDLNAEETFEQVFEAIKKHHSAIFTEWPLSDVEIEKKLKNK